MRISYDYGAGIFFDKNQQIKYILAGDSANRPDMKWLEENILLKIKRK